MSLTGFRKFVRVLRFAEFKKKLGTSHAPTSLIGRAIEKFDFKRSQLERLWEFYI